ncbi:hypothetical protein V474_22410 [Novosphingobium barchaimii LL02]|uniref:Uncharacterized protein n=1 Tax=Novosphingobium barchaimii LL02 TaxID=1114963 RepID=A0A0J8AEP8_9SPHN|nr:hypothetical protein [Novosphingobium barchaimii]KMS53470.1 hypothetical protein V474_22410 [Novosphingobium barchaimii LL02]
MISAALLALVSLSSPFAAPAPAPAPAPAAYAGETIAAMKGHPTPARSSAARSAAPAVCHPDPSKGRACRHVIVQAEQAERATVAVADGGAAREHAR